MRGAGTVRPGSETTVDNSRRMRYMNEPSDLAADTLAVHSGRGERAPGSPLNLPPQMASAFRFGGGSPYTRYDNPSFTALEDAVGALEPGHVLAFASGMAGISAVPGYAATARPHGRSRPPDLHPG